MTPRGPRLPALLLAADAPPGAPPRGSIGLRMLAFHAVSEDVA